MTVIFILLMKTLFTGLLLHELLGLLLFLLFILHKIWNWTFIKKTSMQILKGDLALKIKLNYVLDWLLFLDTLMIIISGVLISQELFPVIKIDDIYTWSTLHHFFAYLGLIIIGLHLGLHFNIMVIQLKKIFNIKWQLPKTIINILTTLLLLIGLKSLVDSKLVNSLKKPFTKVDGHYAEDSHTAMAIQKYVNEAQPTLEEYLGSLFCNGCGRNCPLSNPQCGVGVRLAQEATVDYQVKYSANKTETSNSGPINEKVPPEEKDDIGDDEDYDIDIENEKAEDKSIINSASRNSLKADDDTESEYINILGILSFFTIIGNFIRKKLK